MTQEELLHLIHSKIVEFESTTKLHTNYIILGITHCQTIFESFDCVYDAKSEHTKLRLLNMSVTIDKDNPTRVAVGYVTGGDTYGS